MRGHSICIWSFASSSLLQWLSLSPKHAGPRAQAAIHDNFRSTDVNDRVYCRNNELYINGAARSHVEYTVAAAVKSCGQQQLHARSPAPHCDFTRAQSELRRTALASPELLSLKYLCSQGLKITGMTSSTCGVKTTNRGRAVFCVPEVNK